MGRGYRNSCWELDAGAFRICTVSEVKIHNVVAFSSFFDSVTNNSLWKPFEIFDGINNDHIRVPNHKHFDGTGYYCARHHCSHCLNKYLIIERNMGNSSDRNLTFISSHVCFCPLFCDKMRNLYFCVISYFVWSVCCYVHNFARWINPIFQLWLIIRKLAQMQNIREIWFASWLSCASCCPYYCANRW